ncbi:MAG: AmmeMemoRadiSam system protein B [Candidatus Acidiferrales bacterium]
MIRQPAVAGRFYPSHPAELAREIDGYLSVDAPLAPPQRVLACVAPHAGIMYSGSVAGAVYARIELPRRMIILCPNHFGVGQRLAIFSSGAWRTPLGDAPVDSERAARLQRACPLLREDAEAHAGEHSLEVQLPFLQRRAPHFRFVPIALATDRFDAIADLGHAIAAVIRESASDADPILIIASSDMNHYESDAVTRVKDRKAIDRILALDSRALYDTVRTERISMCGYGPATAMLVAARELGAARAELVRYATSGDVTGDFARVVGYAGIVVM